MQAQRSATNKVIESIEVWLASDLTPNLINTDPTPKPISELDQ